MIALPDSAKAGMIHSRIWRDFDSFVSRQSVRYGRIALDILAAEGVRAGAAYADGGERAAHEAVNQDEWFAYVAKVWYAVVPDAGEVIEPYLIAITAAAVADALVSAARIWIRENGMREAIEITRTSRRNISDQIRIGVTKGESHDEIAARIRKHYRSINQGRAGTIARTEVHAAANFGSLTTASEQREPMRKIWLATPDGLTRDEHMEASGQKRALGEPFNIDGEPLQFPGDSSLGARPELVINCRCTLAYERMRRPVRPPKPRRAA